MGIPRFCRLPPVRSSPAWLDPRFLVTWCWEPHSPVSSLRHLWFFWVALCALLFCQLAAGRSLAWFWAPRVVGVGVRLGRGGSPPPPCVAGGGLSGAGFFRLSFYARPPLAACSGSAGRFPFGGRFFSLILDRFAVALHRRGPVTPHPLGNAPQPRSLSPRVIYSSFSSAQRPQVRFHACDAFFTATGGNLVPPIQAVLTHCSFGVLETDYRRYKSLNSQTSSDQAAFVCLRCFSYVQEFVFRIPISTIGHRGSLSAFSVR